MTLTELYQLAERDRITVDAFPLSHREAIALLDEDGDCFIAIDSLRLRSVADEMTKLGHELGHCETGAFYNRYSPYDLPARHEHRAARWAIEHLVPEEELAELVMDGRTEVWELAEHFSVTEELMRAAILRYRSDVPCA